MSSENAAVVSGQLLVTSAPDAEPVAVLAAGLIGSVIRLRSVHMNDYIYSTKWNLDANRKLVLCNCNVDANHEGLSDESSWEVERVEDAPTQIRLRSVSYKRCYLYVADRKKQQDQTSRHVNVWNKTDPCSDDLLSKARFELIPLPLQDAQPGLVMLRSVHNIDEYLFVSDVDYVCTHSYFISFYLPA